MAGLPVVGPQRAPGEIPATAVALRLCSKSFFKVDINGSGSHYALSRTALVTPVAFMILTSHEDERA